MTREPPAAPLIVVVAYCADDHLGSCLRELGPADVVVVDNDPNPSTERLARAADARYVAAEGNIGFARAVNLAIAECWDGRSDVLLLNPDARFTHDNVLALQMELHRSGGRLAAVGPRLIGVDGAPQPADWPMPSPASVWLDAVGASRLWRGRRFVVGAILLLNGEALAALGPLDERYFLYAEETDWQMRALRAGWSVAVVDSVVGVHAGGASSSDDTLRAQLFHASGQKFARRWYGRVGAVTMRAGSVVAALRRALFGDPAARRSSRTVLRMLLGGAAETSVPGGST